MNNPELVYYGHTCQTLARRFGHHKSNHNKSSSKQIIDKGDAIILLVEDYPCLNINEARAREGYYILNNPCVNKNVSGRTIKQYYADNHDKLIEYQIEYNLIHKEKKNAYDREYHRLRREKNKLMQLNINNNNAINQEIV